ncbi:MAG: glycosyltransferase family 2 protein [Paramuribaculum sp.]|nr:glycosyltransferase family 2 protein [Paramuribaculum sp.]
MPKISATILTYNEEHRIGACLESLQDIADEIVIVDSGSTDNTVEICKRYGCSVRVRPFRGFGSQRQYATSLTTHAYVLTIDADEVLSPALRQSLMKLKVEGFTHRGYCMSRLNFYCGVPVKHCGWYPDVQTRLFDKRYANWNMRDVAEKVIFRDNVTPEPLDGDILHYRCETPAEFIEKERNHSYILAHDIADRKGDIMPVTPMAAALKAFIKCYFLQGGMLDGLAGRRISVARYHSTLLAYKAARKVRTKTGF